MHGGGQGEQQKREKKAKKEKEAKFDRKGSKDSTTAGAAAGAESSISIASSSSREKDSHKGAQRKEKRSSKAVRVFGGELKDGLYDKRGLKYSVPPFFEQALTFLEERGWLPLPSLFSLLPPKSGKNGGTSLPALPLPRLVENPPLMCGRRLLAAAVALVSLSRTADGGSVHGDSTQEGGQGACQAS